MKHVEKYESLMNKNRFLNKEMNLKMEEGLKGCNDCQL